MSTLLKGLKRHSTFGITQTDLLAPTAKQQVAPMSGVARKLVVIVQVAVTTGGTIVVKHGTTNVAGLSVTVANGAAVGTIYTATASGDGTEAVAEGDRMQVTPASFATAGAVEGYIEYSDSL